MVAPFLVLRVPEARRLVEAALFLVTISPLLEPLVVGLAVAAHEPPPARWPSTGRPSRSRSTSSY